MRVPTASTLNKLIALAWWGSLSINQQNFIAKTMKPSLSIELFCASIISIQEAYSDRVWDQQEGWPT